MKEFGLDLGLLLSQMVNFGLLFALLAVLLYKPILGKLEERARRIKKGVDDAEQAAKLLAEAQARYQAELERAQREAHELIEQATRTAEQQREKMLAHARQEAQQLILRAQQQAQRELQEGRVALNQQIIDLAIAAAARLLQENLDDEKQHQLVRDFLAEANHLP